MRLNYELTTSYVDTMLCEDQWKMHFGSILCFKCSIHAQTIVLSSFGNNMICSYAKYSNSFIEMSRVLVDIHPNTWAEFHVSNLTSVYLRFYSSERKFIVLKIKRMIEIMKHTNTRPFGNYFFFKSNVALFITQHSAFELDGFCINFILRKRKMFRLV